MRDLIPRAVKVIHGVQNMHRVGSKCSTSKNGDRG